MTNRTYSTSLYAGKRRTRRQIRMIMRLTTLLIIISTLTTSATGFSQEVNLSLKDIPLKVAFSQIRQQTGYSFLWTEKTLSDLPPINASVHGLSVKEALKVCLQRLPLTFDIHGKVVYIKRKQVNPVEKNQNVQPAEDPLRQVTGVVIDSATKEPLAGVTIKVEGKTVGTVTDTQGKFSLTIENGSKLVVSYLGYATRTIPIGSEINLNIELSAIAKGLNQLIVIGYGKIQKKDLTASVSQVDGEKIIKATPSNLSNALVGRLPGLIAVQPNGAPGSGSEISIRGTSTFGDNSALVVIDGIVKSYAQFQQLNPNDIASISILKDASATAVYGSRGANGVILVTTKTGSIGKPSFHYNGYVGVQQPTLYPKLMDGLQYAKTRNQARKNMGLPDYYTTQEIKDIGDGKTPQTNWYNLTLNKNAPITSHDISIDGGTEKLKYFLSAGYLYQDGLYKSNDLYYKRYSLRSNVDASIGENLTISVNLSAIVSKDNGSSYSPEQIFSDIMAAYPMDMVYNPDGTIFYTHEQHPVAEISSGYNKQSNNTYDATFNVKEDLPFIDGLSLGGQISFGRSHILDKNYQLPIFMHREDSEGNLLEIYPFGGYQGKVAINKSYNEYNTSTINARLTYDNIFGNNSVKGLLLFEQFNAEASYFNGFRTNFPAPGLDQLLFGGEAQKDANGDTYSDGRRSYVGRLNYSFKEKFLFEATLRVDGSVAFPKSGRYGYFPAFSAGWVISEEPFIKNKTAFNFINNLKLRASYGVVGNDKNVYGGDRPTFQFEQAYNLGPALISANQPVPTIVPGVLPNPSITWETAHISDIGLDASLFNNKVALTLDGFYKRTSNILLARIRSIPSTLGASLPAENYAIVDNKGIEVSLEYNDKVGGLNYFVGLNGSWSNNKVVRIDEPANIPVGLKQTGRPLGFIIGYKALGIFKTDEEATSYYNQFGIQPSAGDIKYADINGDEKIDVNDRVVISENNSTPKMIWGLTFGGSFKRFDLNVLFQGAADVNQLLQGRSITFFRGGSQNNFKYLLDYWTPQNINAKFPRPWEGDNPNNSLPSSFYLRNSSFVRLKSINLGYSISPKFLEQVHFKEARVYLSGTNIFVLSKMKYWDPEIGNTDGSYYPQQRVLNLGIDLSF